MKKDLTTSTIEMVYGEASLEETEDMRNVDPELSANPDTLIVEEPDPEISPVAEEGTPVDPAAPPADIMPGTDLLNGYNGDGEEEQQ
ncbi:hypothetical protein [Paenibacillus eucommiae]|uniref:Uncharacterized protein n=1 Tax=Paenibacillus eucommiae TaxID=1355755 RepID=A0ABS4J512_9BACL|nr:hypothetical protein [Paenibacillus eucommiae]MBP1994905.1 hypothetical protein [Paenibacillus eucommiae]